MKFMLFICTDSSVAHVQEPASAIQAWLKEGEERGIRLDGQRLRPPTDAKLVRLRDGERVQLKMTVGTRPTVDSTTEG